jgi:hypothetical protein
LQLNKASRIAPNLVDVERLCSEMVKSLLLSWGADPAAVDAAHTVALEHVGRPGGPS